jgi:phenylalanyl-tRNA synthetase beta chain
MRAPVSWIRDYAALPADAAPAQLAARLTGLGLKLEALSTPGDDLSGPLVVGRVLSRDKEEHKNGKAINWCRVDVGPDHNPPAAAGSGEGAAGRGIVCGAHNFDTGDLVVVALPGAVLPGGFAISARKTYGHVSDGMICSAAELGLGDDAAEIIVLTPGEAQPGDDAAALLHIRDHVIELEINPDRAYALSLRGIARDAALGYRVAFDDPAGLTVRAGEDGSYPVQVTDRDACPLFVTRTVTGFDPTAPTPRWLARRIQLAGMRPISLAVDVTNYVMLELGQPIHGYDRDRLQGAIVVRRAQPGETLRTLDGQDRRLSGEDLLITDDSGPIGLAGVMGGESTEISPATTAVVIEAAAFDPVTTARTARRHKLVSEASRRFERGVDPDLPPVAAQRVADLLVALGGGRTEPGMTVVGSVPPRSPIAIPADLPARVTGIEVDVTTTVGALRDVGCTVDGAASETLHVTPPSWRPDVTDPYDLVEEVARVVGYDQVPSVLPTAPAGRGLTTAQRLRRRIGTGLAGAGFTEVVAYPFVGEPDLDALGLAADDPRRTAPRVANPVSEREPLLHTTLAPALLKVLARNAGAASPTAGCRCWHGSSDPTTGHRLPHRAAGRPAPTAAELAALDAAVPHQPYHLAVVVSGHPGTTRSSGRCATGGLGRGARRGARGGPPAGTAGDGRCRRDRSLAPGAMCPHLDPGTGGEVIVGHAGELHPRVCRRSGCRSVRRTRRSMSTSWWPPRRRCARARLLDHAGGQERRRAGGRCGGARRRRRGGAAAGSRTAAGVDPLFDVYTGEQVPRGASRWRTRCGSGRRTARSPTRRWRAPGRWRWRPR